MTDIRQCVQLEVDGINDHLVSCARNEEINAVPLYDLSGGAGIVPDSWPVQVPGIYSGYAGGLGPGNVLAEVERINKSAREDGLAWIDMETKVRTPDDSRLDCGAVERVLTQMAESPFLAAKLTS